MNRKKGCFGCSAVSVLIIAVLLILGVKEADKLTTRVNDEFVKNKQQIIADMTTAIDGGNPTKAIEIAKPYELVTDYDLRKLESKAQKLIDKLKANEVRDGAEKRTAEEAAKAASKPIETTGADSLTIDIPLPEYSIISDDSSGSIKRSVDVRLAEKVSAKVLRAIGEKIHAMKSTSFFDRTFICYYLPHQTPGEGAWATTHFDPNIKVDILGFEAGHPNEESLPFDKDRIGQWEFSNAGGSIYTLSRLGSGFALRIDFQDGSRFDDSVSAIRDGEKVIIRSLDPSNSEDYLILDEDKNLLLMDSQGLNGKAIKIKSPEETKATPEAKEQLADARDTPRVDAQAIEQEKHESLMAALIENGEYVMREIPLDDPRWQNALDRINRVIAVTDKGEEKTVEILQHIVETSYLARTRTPRQTAGSVASAIGSISGRQNSIVPPGEWETIRIDLPKTSKQFADGEKFITRIKETGKTFQYTTTLGAKATVKVCSIAGRGISKEEFVSRLKTGETWKVNTIQVTQTCNFCRGAKVINGATCPRCKGVGGDFIRKPLTIRW